MGAFDMVPIDPFGAYQQGASARQGIEGQNALRQYAGAAMAGDQNALAMIAQYDPMLAFQLSSGIKDDARADASLDLQRQGFKSDEAHRNRSFGLQERGFEADEAYRAENLALMKRRGAEETASHAATMDANARTLKAEEATRYSKALAWAYDGGAEEFEARMAQLRPELPDNLDTITYEAMPGIMAFMEGGLEALAGDGAMSGGAQTRHDQAIAGGYVEGTPEYQDYMLHGGTERTEDLTTQYRPATAEEAAVYGATGGQIDTRTNRFYASETRDTTTEGERKGAGMYERMVAAEKTLQDLAAEGSDRLSIFEKGKAKVLPEGYALGNESQKVLQAQRDWVRAKLRLESGAVIGDEEMAEEIRTYFPSPGEGPEVVAQKAQARQQAMEQVKTQSGRAAPKTQVTPPNVTGDDVDSVLERWR
jgi:hypothetical protein